MTGSELRGQFLDFFRERKHAILPGDSLIPAKDPTLLFTGAGMNQFKVYFLGLRRDLKRAATCQKCFRTGDVEKVGQTAGHLTFFEMLGNFSFGDYFKREACAWAWEFLTGRLGLDPERLWATVYESDEEAAAIWREVAALPEDRIVRFGAKENFWPSDAPAEGPDGPCGPCSELHWDYRRCVVGKHCPDPDHCGPGCPCGRFAEVWNLVFTQYDRQPNGELLPLPAKNIDTGMGLERLAAVAQDKMSVFETDLFEPLVEATVRLLREEAPGILRVDQRASVCAICDHARALAFLIADGVVPSNDGRGYVLRMLLRRAARAGRGLGLQKPFVYRLVPVVARTMEGAYPELSHRREGIAQVILAEEQRFCETLEEKIPLLKEEVRRIKLAAQAAGRAATAPALPADLAARFYDTHGISYEEIVQATKEEQVRPPTKEAFDKALEQIQAKSKEASAFGGAIFAKEAVHDLVAGLRAATEFVGYDQLTGQGKVIALIQENRLVDQARAPAAVGVILDRSPFYGEAGGQVGDTGVLQAPEAKLRVTDTQWVGSLLLHQGQILEGRIRVSDVVSAQVDGERRRQIARNHTGTHLLHAALRKVLGSHVVQAGSLVAPDHLRFDFSHGRALAATERESVESLANEWIGANLAVSVVRMPLEEARRSGALAFFADTYGTTVRVVEIGGVSRELCGGTHLKASGEVGLLTIAEEGSISSGVRRIEALSDQAALDSLKAEVARLEEEHARLVKRGQQLEMERKSLKVKGAV